MLPATEIEGKPLGKWRYSADCSHMSEIGSVSMLASQAAQPFVSGTATSVDVARPSAGEAGAAPVSAAEFSSDYAMSLLAKITHASADQALTLIQGMLKPTA